MGAFQLMINQHIATLMGNGTYHYAEPMSCYNCSKHVVNDVNDHCHDQISLEDIWETKWWHTL